MVTLFFAISGYVLSYNFLSLCRKNEWPKAFSRLASLTLRRWMRLFMPASVSMLLVCLAVQLGAFESGRELRKHPMQIGKWEEHPPRFSSWKAQIQDFGGMCWHWSNPFRWDLNYSPYDPHTWTIPVELRCSMVLFVFLLASAGLKQRWRYGLTLLVAVYCLLQRRWDVATFVEGALVADLHQAAHEPEAGLLPINTHIASRRTALTITTLKWLLLTIALHILSFPDNLPEATFGFSFLHSVTPPAYIESFHFWHAVASSLILWCVQSIPSIRVFLSSGIPQYFGKTSYALYLVHGPLLHSVGFNLQPKIWEITGSEGLVQWSAGLFVGWVIMLSLSIMVAHLFWKMIDMPFVKFTRWLEEVARDECAFQGGGEKHLGS